MKSPEEVQAALKDVLENHARYATLKELVTALREANNYMPEKELAKKLDMLQPSMANSLRVTPYRAAEKICAVNPFGFSEEDGTTAIARQIFFSKTPEKRFWSERLIDVSRQAIIAEVTDKVAHYQKGQLSSSDLPQFKDVLRGLYPIKHFDMHSIVKAMLEVEAARVAQGETPLLSEQDKENLSSRMTNFFSQLKPKPEEYILLLAAAGVPKDNITAFSLLPVGKIKQQTPFTKNFHELLQQHAERKPNGMPNQKAFGRYTKLVDPNHEGLTDAAIGQLLHGQSEPTRHSVRLLAQVFTRKIIGKTAGSIEELPDKVKAFIESAGFTPEQLIRTSHEVIAAATLDTPIIELWRELRLASDVNQPVAEFVKNTDFNLNTYQYWELNKSFPEGNSLMHLCEQLIARVESFLPKHPNGQLDMLSDEEKDKICTIARASLQRHQEAQDKDTQARSLTAAETRRRFNASRRTAQMDK